MRGFKILIFLLISNLLLFTHSVNATINQVKLFEDEKLQITYLQKGRILPKNSKLDEDLTYKEFLNWLQFFTYDEKKMLLAMPQNNEKILKLKLKELNITTYYEKWEKTGILKKPMNYKDFYTILFKLVGYENLSEQQINNLIELEAYLSKEELNFLTKNNGLKKKIGAVMFARFMKQFQTSKYSTSSQTTTSDKTLFLNEGPSTNFQHIIEIPKKKSFILLAKVGKINVAKYNGKIGYITSDLGDPIKFNRFTITANKVNLRLGPSIDHPVVKVLNKNEKITGTQFNADWVQIHSVTGKAFIASNYVKKIDSTENNDDTENLVKKVYVTADKLNIRAEQSVTSSIIGSVSKGDVLEVILKYPKWTKIKYKNLIGYVSNEYITEQPISISKDIVIAIDAGHGGKDPGTHSNQLNEKDITLDTALKVRQSFINTNVKVVLTRETDVFLDLGERVRIAKNNKAILFVSIHVNSGSGQNGGGSETYYYGNSGKNPYISESQSLASFIQNEMLNAWHLTDRGVHHGNFQVIRDNSMPAVLTELGFIDSKKDQTYLSSSEKRTIIAGAIHDGILHYLESQGYKVKQS